MNTNAVVKWRANRPIQNNLSGQLERFSLSSYVKSQMLKSSFLQTASPNSIKCLIQL